MSQRRYGRKTTFYPAVETTHRASRFSQRLASGFTWTDLFCGGGGSSEGLKGKGGDVVVASNHWQLAVDTHEANHPETHHVCADISAADPRNFPSTTGLWASPECTWHSPAGGRKRPTRQQYLFTEWEPERNEQGERSRATMWDVVRFAEAHRYKVIIVENVVDVFAWELFDYWWQGMTQALGYEGRKVSLNSMFCWPTPQSRDRIYMVFWQKGMPAPDLDIQPLAHCPRCERDVNAVQSWKNGRSVGKYKQQYVYCCPLCAHEVTPYYYAAANAIDWSLPIERIGDRKHPLKPKTLERIQAGLEKYGRNPLLLVANHRGAGNLHTANMHPFPTQTSGTTMGLTMPGQPFVLAPGSYGLPQGVYDEPLPAQTCNATPHFVVPWLLEVGHGGPENAGRVKGIVDPIPTVHTLGGLGVAMAPLLVDSGGVWESDARPVLSEPYPTQSSRRQPGMLMAPYVVNMHADNAPTGIVDPLNTVATGNGHGVALAPQPFTVSYNGQLNEPLSALTEPLSTATSVARHGVAIPQGDGRELPALDDCYYRTLKAHEIKRAMGFRPDYTLLGDSKSQVKMAGNAVTPSSASVLAERVMASVD